MICTTRTICMKHEGGKGRGSMNRARDRRRATDNAVRSTAGNISYGND